MKANEIITVLNHFKDSSYQRILINGTWGIGKTKYVTDFMKEYSEVCYVSLFGKRDINSIIQEIYFRILQTANKGRLKKHFRTFRELLSKFNFSYYGVSISIPFIENLHNELTKELGLQGTYIIIFDDLERKHDDLGIKEIFGLLDSLSKINSIKTVLISAKDQLKGEDLEIFKDYQEKAIDRIYTIEDYAVQAPKEILGEQVWNVIGNLTEEFEFKNLRTFEKTNLFISEVIGVLGENIFTEKFPRNDLYRMCFATVFFIMEHHSEMKLLNISDEKSEFLSAYYKEDKNGVIDYLCDYILRNSLDNSMSKNVFNHINTWYRTGTYNIESINNIIASINSYERKPSNFYSSKEEIIGIIEYSREYIRNLNGTERLEDIISNLSIAFKWCEILSLDFGIDNEEILQLVRDNISNIINPENTIYQNKIDFWDYNFESEEARNLAESINKAVKTEYCNQLINRITECYSERSFKNFHYIRKLIESIPEVENQNRECLITSIKENEYFFPIPAGRITEAQWHWCHQIVSLIANIGKHWNLTGYFNGFSTYIYSLEITKKDQILQHRLNQLFGKKR
ncbi:hypothetical protein IIE26_19780 [Cytobacillus oceanisediminis]|uniref:hypothetical protein n=1 Tax=Cytobacillus oceanisediminis TaxID=665099 RepID=UPI00186556C3|nr:hypothetical protein [Cytobacillus oceanisediminis]QOK25898.1 hypothetical protein IIE26_19780 [Cytobacillus oceanisediminis]